MTLYSKKTGSTVQEKAEHGSVFRATGLNA
jgi:hypothetical protein